MRTLSLLIIFDVDGTLLDGEETDWECFKTALAFGTEKVHSSEFWNSLTEVTARAIVHQATEERDEQCRGEIEARVCDRFLTELINAHARNPSAFSAKEGAISLLDFLDGKQDVKVAIATGDWFETISFKLKSANVVIDQYAIATSSDCLRRADIIRLASRRAGSSLKEAVYVGDGLWDLRACQELGIPFVGVGSKRAEFYDAGAKHVLDTLNISGFVSVMEQIRHAF